MIPEIPDFTSKSWLELEAKRRILNLTDGSPAMEIRIYRKIDTRGETPTGYLYFIFGKPALKRWNVFENGEEIIYVALETHQGAWEVSIPMPSVLRGTEEKKKWYIIIKSDLQNPYVRLLVPGKNRLLENIFYRNQQPPNK